VNNNKIQLENFMDFNSDAVITIGTRIAADNVKVERYINKILHNEGSEFIYMHPIDDVSLQDKYTQYIKYEAGSEEGVFALLAFFLTQNSSKEIQEYLDDLDIGYLSGESSVGEEELELLVEKLENKKEITLVIGDDITGHKYFDNISKFIRLIDLYTDINVVLLNADIHIDLSLKVIPDEVDDINTYNGTVVYSIDETENILKGSASFAMAAKIKDGDTVNITYENLTIKKKFQIDASVRGTIALYPIVDTEQEKVMLSGYRFKQVKIQRVES
jgi:NADH-quinone oxidoreductase subunit F